MLQALAEVFLNVYNQQNASQKPTVEKQVVEEEKKVKPRKSRAKPKVKTQWKGGDKSKEPEVRKIFEKLFNAPFPKKRPKFLKNPKTGRSLELDGYNAELKIAFEYNGAQHAQKHPFYHKDEKDYEEGLERDMLKRSRCKEQKIILVSIPHWVPYHELEEFIVAEVAKQKLMLG